MQRFIFLLSFLLGLGLLPADLLGQGEPLFHETSVSPDVNCHQGYATDGTNHFTIDTAAIYKRLNDREWTVVASNTAPFSGLTGITHLGDGDYYQGKLYIVGEMWNGCANVSHQSILIFDANTLARLDVKDVSAQHHEVSGLAVAPDLGPNGRIYVTSYCDGTRIYLYDLASFEYLGVMRLSESLPYLQGVTYSQGTFYAAGDEGAIYSITRQGAVATVYHDPHHGSHEGLKYVGDGIRWLIDEGKGNKRIHYLARH
jgi:outer membrane protein assembly factor BamB